MVVLQVTSYVFLPTTHYGFTLKIVAHLALSSQVQSLSHLSLSFPQIDSITQVLLSCANITRTHYIKGVKASHYFQSHISHGDHAPLERALSRSERLFLGLKFGLKTYLRCLLINQTNLCSANNSIHRIHQGANQFTSTGMGLLDHKSLNLFISIIMGVFHGF
jgi:hypothetical protein